MGYRDDLPLRHIREESSSVKGNGACQLCGNKVSFDSSAFYCHTCRSHYHKDCFTITYPKIHEHTLTFIHRNSAFTCDACGWAGGESITDMFGCLNCDFFVHRYCIFLPKVIKITRHSHYLFHTFSIPDGNLQCKVCHSNIHKLKIGYGGYICMNKACDYVVHTRCATMKKVWDGRDIEEEEPEEESNSEVDHPALVEIDGRPIRHFSHDHDLTKFDEDGKEESGQVCQACILPIDFGSFLSCKKCDFALHNACASLPRKLEHVLHRHPLTLLIDMMNIEEGFFTCSICCRESCGFMYKCCQEDCEFKIDVKCALFVEPFNHVAHPAHPLFFTQYSDNTRYPCKGCDQWSTTQGVTHCNVCYFPLEFKCVTLPRLVKYKHDVHPLTLYCDRDYKMRSVKPPYWWCEICEERINVEKLFYICHDCITTLHTECMLGKYPYLKPGHRIKVDGLELEIASNHGVSRSVCRTCHRICQDKLVFINGEKVCFCSIDCIHCTKAGENLIWGK